MDRSELKEIKKGETGKGILIEHDGYIDVNCGSNKKLFEAIGVDGMEQICPEHFIVDAVFQKYGIENANGRIYPENVLRREVEKYLKRVEQHWAYGECYTPDAQAYTKRGWVSIGALSEDDELYTLNPYTNKYELKPLSTLHKHFCKGNIMSVTSEWINDKVTPNHQYPLYKKDGDKYIFYDFKTIEEINELKNNEDTYYIPVSFEDFSIVEDIHNLNITSIPYNGYVYCPEVENHIWFVQQGGKSHWSKNCNHPSESVIDLSRVAMNIVELHWVNSTLVGKLEIITSPGYRKHGIISCQGDQVANLLLSGLRIGVSSRGLGTVTQKMGVLYVADDYEIVCWDVVSDPSTPGAFISSNGEEELQQYVESTKTNKPKINESLQNKLSKFEDWLNN